MIIWVFSYRRGMRTTLFGLQLPEGERSLRALTFLNYEKQLGKFSLHGTETQICAKQYFPWFNFRESLKPSRTLGHIKPAISQIYYLTKQNSRAWKRGHSSNNLLTITLAAPLLRIIFLKYLTGTSNCTWIRFETIVMGINLVYLQYFYFWFKVNRLEKGHYIPRDTRWLFWSFTLIAA